jgi:hypothetical protein
LDKLTNNGKNNSLLNDAIAKFNTNSVGDIKQKIEIKRGINTLIEHAVAKTGGADRLGKDLDDDFDFYLEKLKPISSKNIIGHSRNPKDMHKLIKSKISEHLHEQIDPTPTNIIND